MSTKLQKKSKRFMDLEKELFILKQNFLPKRFSPIGRYSEEIYSFARAYRILVHAELESYLEDRAKELCENAMQVWEEDKRVSKTLLCLIAFSGRAMEAPPETQAPTQENQRKSWNEKTTVDGKIKLAINDFYRAIGNNHGIKEKNILRLLLPVGMEIDDLDAYWLIEMNSFGEKRGILAHKSSSFFRVQQPPDPRSEWDAVKNILRGLRDIDKKLNMLKVK